MNPNKRLNEEALNKEFTVKMKRRDIVNILTVINKREYTLAEAEALINATAAFNDAMVLTDKDYIQPSPPPPVTNGVKV